MKITEKRAGENARTYANRMILENIVDLELPPGVGLSENELSIQLNLSRTPVREALIEMSRIGMVEIIPKKGSFVTRIDYDFIEEARFMRMSLENSVLDLACREGISAGALSKLEENLEEQKKVAQPLEDVALMDLDNAFHRLLFDSVNKGRVYAVLQSQMVHFDRLRNLSLRTLKVKAGITVNDHENILYALKKRDCELAEMVMTRHLTRHQVEKKDLCALYPDYFLLGMIRGHVPDI